MRKALTFYSVAVLTGASTLLMSCPTNAQQTGIVPTVSATATIHGISRERLDRIAPVMKQQIDKGVFPGAVTLIARQGAVVHFEAHGFQDAAKSKPMAKDSIFPLASMTKPIVTVAAMILVEQGVLKINDPIGRYLPELKDLKVEVSKRNADDTITTEDVPASRAITIQDLMRHSSGFFYSGAMQSKRLKEAYQQANIEGSNADITAEEMLKRLGQIPLAHQPGTNFLYSISTDVLGLLLERITKKSLDVLLQEMVIGPLGMKDTAFWVPAEKATRLAELLDSDALKKSSLRFCRTENEIKKSYLKGGAGLCSTAEDYLKFVQMIANRGEYQGKRYLSKKTVEFMLQDHLVGIQGAPVGGAGPGYGFGLGFAVRVHDGVGWSAGSKGDAMWAGAFGTFFTIDPKEELVAILMTTGAVPRLESRHLFKNLVYGAIVE